MCCEVAEAVRLFRFSWKWRRRSPRSNGSTTRRKRRSPSWRRHLLEKEPISKLCDELGLQPTAEGFFEHGAAALSRNLGRTIHRAGKCRRIVFRLSRVHELLRPAATEAVFKDLGNLFVTFERCARRHSHEKIKTMGDAFLATVGLLEPVDDALHAAVSCALAISEEATRSGRGWQVRSGFTSDP